jgi:hypothetical protein
MFTDIEGSTGLVRGLGERYGAVLERQELTLAYADGALNGTAVKKAGKATECS